MFTYFIMYTPKQCLYENMFRLHAASYGMSTEYHIIDKRYPGNTLRFRGNTANVCTVVVRARADAENASRRFSPLEPQQFRGKRDFRFKCSTRVNLSKAASYDQRIAKTTAKLRDARTSRF